MYGSVADRLDGKDIEWKKVYEKEAGSRMLICRWKSSLRSSRIKERGWGRRKIDKKRWSGGGGGRGKRTPAIKAPIGSFLRSLAAAKF